MGILRQKKQPAFKGSGLVIFADVHEALKAEQVLKEADYGVKLVAPPPALRKGCDLAIEMNLVEQFGIERLFREKDVAYIEILPLAASALR